MVFKGAQQSVPLWKDPHLTPAETLIEDLSALEPIKTWSLIVTLFGDLNGQPVTGKQLGAILGRVGIKTEAMRVALHRLRKEGWIVSTKIGREVLPLLDTFLNTNDLEIVARIKQIKAALKKR